MNRTRPVGSRSRIPDFLDSGTTAAYLDMHPKTLRNILPYMHSLELPHDEDTQRIHNRFPVPFLVPLKSALQVHSHLGYTKTAEAFSRTQAAGDAILASEIMLDKKLADTAEDGLLSRTQIATLLNVGRTSINGWMEKGFIEVAQGDEDELPTSVEGLKHALIWVRPNAYDPLLRRLDEELIPHDLELRFPDQLNPLQ